MYRIAILYLIILARTTVISFIRNRENIERYAARGLSRVESEKWQCIERLSSMCRYY